MLWDNNSDWVAGFVRKFGSMSSVLAELCALEDGLLLARARQLDILNVNIELDADLLVHLLNNPPLIISC